MNEDISKFVSERINRHGQSEPEGLQNAYLAFKSCTDNLRKTLSAEQIKLLNKCENAYHLLDGETSTTTTARDFPMRLYFGTAGKTENG